MKIQPWALKLLRENRIAHLATSTTDGRPHVVPICYAWDVNNRVYSPIDKKPKRVKSQRLRRVLNILSNPNIALVVDSYSENWDDLKYVKVDGQAKVLKRGRERQRAVRLLRRKYTQYRAMGIEHCPIIMVKTVRIVAWKSADSHVKGKR